ncbi:hypothetical protein BDV23DRAFT_163525 [Aspergillus alliaceus]|uniref:Uncharacterized protein n=1 Tax=Petromyces alliaceus TaxID=209559 RepID=A0A5N7BWV4_PETAA|nr:hypothetical protein BDV23DRAFT_163525 [Aspergillus alliaceus]
MSQRQRERSQREKHIAQRPSTVRTLQPAPAPKNVQLTLADSSKDVGRSKQCLAPMTLTLNHLFPSEIAPHPQNGAQNCDQFTPSLDFLDSNLLRDAMPLDLYRNTLELTHTTLLRACVHNAQSLGINIEDFFSY